MATLLCFARSLLTVLLTAFVSVLVAISFFVGGLWELRRTPIGFVSDPIYVQVSRFLSAFGNGNRTEGMIAIALALSFVIALLSVFISYKRSQRSLWHLAADKD